ncbi:MAG TPA: carbohydrate-binding family 9-like protein, partial [Candidatus Brocadiia bacterium]|nr:carbohydrate-binding family 9-like protein [Candidatus Brocadiia bacterium]
LRPTESQGYVIHYDPAMRRFLLAGRDGAGAIYACVTLAQLFNVENGRLTLWPAQVRDWPDYKIRCMTDMRQVVPHEADPALRRTPAWQAKAVAQGQAFIDDTLLASKRNCIELSSWFFGRDGDDSLIEAAASGDYEYLRKVIAYARQRGVFCSYYAKSAVGLVRKHEKDPRYKGLMQLSGGFHTWGDDELLRERFDAVGKALAHFGVSVAFVHHADTINENWANRSDADRARFGDDRAAADANLIRVYTETLRRHVPGLKVYASIHPYSPDYLERGETFARFLKRLGELMPADVGVTLREGRRKDYDQFHAFYRGRPFMVYQEIHHAIMRDGVMVGVDWPFTTYQGRYAKTFFYPNEDSLYFNLWARGEVNQWLTLQYAWNTDSPGASLDFDYKESHSGFDGACPPAMAGVLRAVCQRVYGEKLADVVAQFRSLPFRPVWVAMPIIARQHCRSYMDSHHLARTPAPDAAEILREQAKSGREGVAIMDKALAQADLSAGERKELESLRRFAVLIESLAPAQEQYVLANDLIEQDQAAQALAAVDKGEAMMKEAGRRLAEERVAGTEWALCGLVDGKRAPPIWRDEYIEKVFLKRFAALRAAIASGGATAERAASKEAVAKAAKRRLVCAAAPADLAAGAWPNDAAWRAAPETTGFLAAGKDRRGRIVYPEAQTSVRFLRGKDGLYVSIICREDSTDSLAASAEKRDDFAIFRDDEVELFFIPDPKNGRRCHLVLNSAGQRLDMLPEPLAGGLVELNKRWNPDWTVKVGVQPGESWSAQVFLPWPLFTTAPFDAISAPPAKGDVWKAFVGRSRRGMEYSGVTWTQSFNDTTAYPDLVFE